MEGLKAGSSTCLRREVGTLSSRRRNRPNQFRALLVANLLVIDHALQPLDLNRPQRVIRLVHVIARPSIVLDRAALQNQNGTDGAMIEQNEHSIDRLRHAAGEIQEQRSLRFGRNIVATCVLEPVGGLVEQVVACGNVSTDTNIDILANGLTTERTCALLSRRFPSLHEYPLALASEYRRPLQTLGFCPWKSYREARSTHQIRGT